MCNLYFYMSVSCWFPESLSVFLGILLKFQTTLQEFSLCLQSGGGLKLCICQIILVSYCERWNFPNGKHYQVFCMYSSSLVRFFKKNMIYLCFLFTWNQKAERLWVLVSFSYQFCCHVHMTCQYSWHCLLLFCCLCSWYDPKRRKKRKSKCSATWFLA